MKKLIKENKLNNYILNPRDANINFQLANEYFNSEQYASALSYYLRCAELSNNDDIVYESLLISWVCIKNVENRSTFERGQLMSIASKFPHKPEVYYNLCNWLEKFGGNVFNSNEEKFQQMYLYACIGEKNIENEVKFQNFNEYPGYYGILFYKAFAGWHIGEKKESEDIFIDLHNNHKLDYYFDTYVRNNINSLNIEHRINEKNI